jgi:RES domain-containing protein
VIVYRIGTVAPAYSADDLSGEGAKISGGRWNRKGVPMVYCASNRALATLETLVHTSRKALPLNRFLVEVDIPDAIWRAATVIDETTAPKGWDSEPAGKPGFDYGDDWIAKKVSAVLVVPSVVVPQEPNILINPLHPDSKVITAAIIGRWLYDARLFGLAA